MFVTIKTNSYFLGLAYLVCSIHVICLVSTLEICSSLFEMKRYIVFYVLHEGFKNPINVKTVFNAGYRLIDSGVYNIPTFPSRCIKGCDRGV